MQVKILIADDHSVVRQGLRHIVETRPGWTVVAEVSTADEVLPVLRSVGADVVVLDVALGDRSGIDVLGHIRAEFPNVPVLMLSMHAEEQYAIRCLRAGASGYIQKERSAEEILTAIERVASRRIYVSEGVSDQMAAELLRGGPSQPHELLSTREFEVFRLIAEGKSPTVIAEALHLSVKTVSTYRSRILLKTGFKSNADIVSYAIRNHLV